MMVFISIDHHSALKDARIPPGPRLLILITSRGPELKMQGGCSWM
ncbi:hypothetical protein CK203_085173 [Vitis vinifera]|uniref:Uncharacterized protein n=1 Tax=Vitis vinifera TaxID=29760 RepID=A0A438E0P8_VITVI|nr:hypothetical protein CK203_085173 [Vitis vinifera]